ncbi:BMP family ABC transporter substrate-binding protein [Brucepastera parasyntrophica]|uniref:BMP family ABC transporter substrate-binding protein n=1 Tax=Brucepastera parasyntrophica TaxID=2880008 RepID=UPI002108FF00|nr:BMP family ABC transporter substrate-binding protein [Brucepastera parasyntrophica]ULQ59080.1 BMP family ABC transporter substrate-binding protein [Brucepastera parasyntrophica]
MKSFFCRRCLFLMTVILSLGFFACSGKNKSGEEIRIAVFVPGIVSGSPVYEMLTEGVTEAVQEGRENGKKINLTIYEAGVNQAEWEMKMISLCAEDSYDLIVSSNPSIPEIAAAASARFPQQEFLILDSRYTGNPNITTFSYNQREQAYVGGYISALVSMSSMRYANPEKKIGLIAAQEYPVMLNTILPAYREGARAVDPGFEVDFRIVGSWNDAVRAAELARSMKSSGSDVIMPVSGAANQGVITAAKESGFYITWFDDNGYSKAPGYVIGSAAMRQDKLAKNATLAWLDGTLDRGQAITVGIADEYVDFISDDPLYINTVPQDIREKMAALMDRLYSGELELSAE